MKKPKPSKHFDKEFGLYVRKKRIQKGWTQAELASRIGNNFQNVSRLERGEVSPTLFWCVNLAKAFDMKLVAFLKSFGGLKG